MPDAGTRRADGACCEFRHGPRPDAEAGASCASKRNGSARLEGSYGSRPRVISQTAQVRSGQVKTPPSALPVDGTRRREDSADADEFWVGPRTRAKKGSSRRCSDSPWVYHLVALDLVCASDLGVFSAVRAEEFGMFRASPPGASPALADRISRRDGGRVSMEASIRQSLASCASSGPCRLGPHGLTNHFSKVGEGVFTIVGAAAKQPETSCSSC